MRPQSFVRCDRMICVPSLVSAALWRRAGIVLSLDERSNAYPARLIGWLTSEGEHWRANMSVVDKALWVIERNSTGELSLPAVAEACGVSRSHLASAFGTTTGWPVMKY